MASPARLVETISQATGVPLPTVTDIDRRLVKAQLRAKGGRGLNAARMTPLDAARILTAILAAPLANAAANAVLRYAATQVDGPRSSDRLFSTSRLPDLGLLPFAHSFVDGLTALVASASMGDLAKLLVVDGECLPRFEVFAFTRAARGRIRITGLPSGQTASVEYRASATKDGAEFEGALGDLEQSRRITERTIYPVAQLLAEENHNG